MNLCDQASLTYIMSSRTAGSQNETLSQKEKMGADVSLKAHPQTQHG